MENNSQLEKVMKNLRQLKKMYEGAKAIDNEGQAAAAAAAIQRLLTRFNLTMEEVGEEKEKSAVIKENVSGYTYKSIGGPWEESLVSCLCRHNFCRCLRYGSYRHLVIVGKPENIEFVKWLRETLAARYVEFSKKSV